MKRKFLAQVIFFWWLAIASFGQSVNHAKLDSFFNVLDSRGLAEGGLAISVKGQLVYQRAAGYAFMDSASKIPSDAKTRYRIGSCSKMFTAVMIFQLIEEKRLQIDQPLHDFFPDLPKSEKINIGLLLNHRSGLHNYTADDTGFPEWMDKPRTHEEMLAVIKEKGTDFEPGTQVQYSNTNYLLLGYIIEQICKIPYEEALRERITSKIGLRDTYYGGPINLKIKESVSYKYGGDGWKAQKETDLSIHGGAGSIVSTPADLVLFIHALFNGKLVDKTSLDKMKTMVDGYGMGLFPYDHGNIKGYGHNGRIEEFYTAVRYYPKEELSFAYCTNGILYPRIDILQAVEKICFNERYTIPFSPMTLPDTAVLNKYTGKYATDQPQIIVNCTREGGKLFLETRGNRFEIEPINENYFMHGPSGIFFEFVPEKGELMIMETDNVYYLSRK
jgi:D-alanyl-D-alanine carboxypeptidase